MQSSGGGIGNGPYQEGKGGCRRSIRGVHVFKNLSRRERNASVDVQSGKTHTLRDVRAVNYRAPLLGVTFLPWKTPLRWEPQCASVRQGLSSCPAARFLLFFFFLEGEREEVGRGMRVRWWRCSWRTGMQRTTRVQITAEITPRRPSATVTAAIILHGCQVRRGFAMQDPPPHTHTHLLWLSAVLCVNVQGWRKSNRRYVQMARRKVDVESGCPAAAVIILMSCRGVHRPSFCSAHTARMLPCKIRGFFWETLMVSCAAGGGIR